ncbi:lactonase family protein [Streptomyces sp. NBC_00988]|uniref:lactonase family protein n=1 Tax=Streptomyces sp. NBC_00988 TaxID=2903704 RepID=UPI00386A6F53|nr:lactonase family protein [Streptomyces sp. NBC_00988]
MTHRVLSRRSALTAAATTALSLTAASTAAATTGPSRRPPEPSYAYVGCYTTPQRAGHGKGIAVFRVDGPGRWQQVDLTETLPNPSFLALDHTQSFLYAVHGDLDQVSAFAIDRHTGSLTSLGTQPSQGTNPVHLTPTPDNERLLVANYATGTLAVLPRTADGRLQPADQVVELIGEPGPDRTQQTGPHPHHIPFAPDRRHVLIPDKGTDRIHHFTYDAGAGRLMPAGPATTVRSGAGPRHITHHPHLPLAYVADELNSQVTTYSYDPMSGDLTPRSWLPTLPPTYTGDSTAAEIQFTPDARLLFVSNRGHDSIATYAVRDDGTLHAPRWTAAGGEQPRFLTTDANGDTLYVANQATDTITAFRITREGRLRPVGRTVATGSPVCIVFRTQD